MIARLRDIPPGWARVIQSTLAVVAIGLLVIHGMDGGHTATTTAKAGGVDATDLAGGGGIALAGKIAWDLIRGMRTSSAVSSSTDTSSEDT